MRSFYFLLIFLIAFGSPATLQAQQGISLGMEGMFGTGWWVHHLGQQTGTSSSSGYDRSHLSLFLQTRAQLGWQSPNWSVLIGPELGFYDDNQLVGSADRRGNRNRITVSNSRGVRMAGGSLALHRRFRPAGKAYFIQAEGLISWRQVKHTHPDQDRMGPLWGQEWALQLGFGHTSLFTLGPYLQTARFGLADAAVGESHRFLLLGLKLRYSFARLFSKT